MFRELLNRILRPVNATYLTLAVMCLLVVFWTLGTPFRDLFRESSGPLPGASEDSAAAPQRQSVLPTQVVASPAPQDATTDYSPSPLPQPVASQSRAQNTRESLDARLARAENETLAKRAAKLVDDCANLSRVSTDLSNRITDLAANDIGRQIAADRPLLLQMITLLDKKPIAVEVLSELSEQVANYHEEINAEVAASPETPISDRVRARLREFAKTVSDYEQALAKYATTLDALTRQSATLDPSELSLAEAIQREAESQASEQLQVAQAEREKVRAENLDAVKDIERQRAEAQLNLQLADAAAEQARLKAQAGVKAKLADAANKQQLLATEFERDLPQIRKYLGPLFEKGRTQPMGRHNIQPTQEEAPVSLSGLHSYGAIGELKEAYPLLLLFFNDNRNDRKSHGPYPYYFGGALKPEQVAAIRPAHDLLLTYGQLLVEKKYLSP